MKIRNKIIAILLAVFFMPAVSMAQTKAGFGVEAGYAWVDTYAEDNAQAIANASGRTTTVTYDEADLAGRIYGYYNFNNQFGIQVGYFKTASLDQTHTNTAGSATISYDATGIDLSGVFKPNNSGFFGKAGIHQSKVNGAASATIGGTSYRLSAADSGMGFLAGIGFEGPIDKNMAWTVGITYYDSLGGLNEADATFVNVGLKF
jgi:YD repeat-containing protein